MQPRTNTFDAGVDPERYDHVDNRCTMHTRSQIDHTQPRELHRSLIKGEPIIAATEIYNLTRTANASWSTSFISLVTFNRRRESRQSI